jgi:hypothetical protein
MLCKTLDGAKDLRSGGIGQVPGEDLVDVWEMHLKAVFVLVCLEGHGIKLPGGVEFRNSRSIKLQVPKGRLVIFAGGKSAAREIDMVRGAEKKDAFTG